MAQSGEEWGNHGQVQGGSRLPKEVTDKREVLPVGDRRDWKTPQLLTTTVQPKAQESMEYVGSQQVCVCVFLSSGYGGGNC